VRILITNDDGIEAPGIAELARSVAGDHEVVVAAPAWNSSGASASITGVSVDGRLVVEDVRMELPAGATAIAVESSPAMIVRAGLQGAFGPPPDLVLSGINDGPNTGHAILHSGTVGAALTAATHGCKAAAFSLGIGAVEDYRAAVSLVGPVLDWICAEDGPITLNVNVPPVAAEDLRGLRVAPLASFGAVQTQVTERGQGYVGLRFEAVDPAAEPDSDACLLAAGYATFTTLRPVCEDRSDRLDRLVAPHR
jgi:5'-nucleotidase